MAANTLIGVKCEEGGLSDPGIEKLQNRLLAIRHKYFNAQNAKKLLDLMKRDGFYNSTDAAKMTAWNTYDQSLSSPFFDPYWMFGINDRIISADFVFFAISSSRFYSIMDRNIHSLSGFLIRSIFSLICCSMSERITQLCPSLFNKT
ncbi:MAG: hypothetical protein LBL45_04670 [Treponema sp.]|nr:hypothetical protein [Treponema sp.]